MYHIEEGRSSCHLVRNSLHIQSHQCPSCTDNHSYLKSFLRKENADFIQIISLVPEQPHYTLCKNTIVLRLQPLDILSLLVLAIFCPFMSTYVLANSCYSMKLKRRICMGKKNLSTAYGQGWLLLLQLCPHSLHGLCTEEQLESVPQNRTAHIIYLTTLVIEVIADIGTRNCFITP